MKSLIEPWDLSELRPSRRLPDIQPLINGCLESEMVP